MALWEDAAGWPMRCLVSLHQEVVAQNTGTSWGLRFGTSRGFLGLPRALPLRPIAVGFTINTLLFAAILWLLIPGPFVLRRFIRRRRGRCPACGYPRGDSSICSECGKPLPQHAVAKT